MNVEVKDMPDPELKNGEELLVRVTSSSICGSDLHLYHGMIPSLEKDYIIGHEAVGIVEEVGKDVTGVKKGDQIVLPFNIACGHCFYCENGLESQCDRSNLEEEPEVGAYFGCSRLYGDYQGSQAELVRVPFANFTRFVVPKDNVLTEDELLLLADALPTAYWGVVNAGVKPGDTVIVIGSGPIGLLTQKLAWFAGAERVIAVDRIDYRLDHARRTNQVEAYHLEKHDRLADELVDLTKGGADVVIDCVGASGKMTPMELAETAMFLQGGAMGAIKLASQVVRKCGVVQLVGVYGLRYNAFPLGDFFARNITLKMGLAPVIHTMSDLYNVLSKQKLKVDDLFTHHIELEQAEHAYQIFNKRKENCLKIILKP